jgi:hypothetical protein
VRIRIEGVDLPGASCGPSPERPTGHPNIHVAVQRRNKPGELLGMVRGDAERAVWTFDCTVTDSGEGLDVAGPYIQGPRGGRFIYLSWGVVDGATFTMFRRAKLRLGDVPPGVLRRAVDGTLVARVGLTDDRGNPRCASVGPDTVGWSAESTTGA